jgi:hypothetical protein
MSDPFREFVEEMARLAVPEDDTEESRGRREAAASESGTRIGELDESDLIACADDEFLCSEALALWAMIRKARALGHVLSNSGFFDFSRICTLQILGVAGNSWHCGERLFVRSGR